MSVEALLEPVSPDDPYGPDLSEDTSRYVLTDLFASSSGIDPVTGAPLEDQTDWRDVTNQVRAAFKQSKDVWLAVYLARAGARAGNLDTVAEATEALARMFEDHWDGVHPRIEELGLLGRKSPCDELCGLGAFLGPLAAAPLVKHPRFGAFSGADLARFVRDGANADNYGMFRALLQEAGDAPLVEARSQLGRIADALRRAEIAFDAHASGGPSPRMSPAVDAVNRMVEDAGAFLSTPAEVEAAPEPEAGAGSAAPAPRQAQGVGDISSRSDVTKALDLIMTYYRRAEPSSPVLLLIQRAREWVDLDFLALVKDMAPNAVNDVMQILMSDAARKNAAETTAEKSTPSSGW
jgi:type VI secretion system ImpA family protein